MTSSSHCMHCPAILVATFRRGDLVSVVIQHLRIRPCNGRTDVLDINDYWVPPVVRPDGSRSYRDDTPAPAKNPWYSHDRKRVEVSEPRLTRRDLTADGRLRRH